MAIDDLERLGDEIAELSAHLNAASARFLALIGEFDERRGWGNGSGFSSCAHWLTWRVGLAPVAAREHVRVARALGSLPSIAGAFASGEISYSKVRALTRIARPETEERLLKVARVGTASHVERIVRGWRKVDRIAEARDTARKHSSRSLRVYRDDDGMVVVRGRLTPEMGAVVMKALDAARETLYRQPLETRVETDPPTAEQQEADALVLLAESALHQGLDPGTAGERYQVVVHVDVPLLADPDAPGQSALEDGDHVPAGTSHRLACDASRVVMQHAADGRVMEVAARTRTIPPALRRALHHRDPGCRFPGCAVRFGQGHHIRHWAEGGPTTLSNLALLCRRHHRAVHEDGYTVERKADGELEFRRPDGRVLPDVPAPPPVREDPVAAMRARHLADGFCLHARTGLPSWLGEGLNVGYAIDVLHPVATREH